MIINLLAPIPPIPPGSNNITNPALKWDIQYLNAEEFFQEFIPKLIGIAYAIGAIIFVFMIIIGGIQWIVSGGDKMSVENARKRIMHAIIGLLILFAVWAIIKLIEGFFGISILSLDIASLEL